MDGIGINGVQREKAAIGVSRLWDEEQRSSFSFNILTLVTVYITQPSPFPFIGRSLSVVKHLNVGPSHCVPTSIILLYASLSHLHL